jgi:hypothetical protein
VEVAGRRNGGGPIAGALLSRGWLMAFDLRTRSSRAST